MSGFCSYFEQISGSQQNWNRDYDPSIGRYLQSDPIGLGGGVNTYGYAYQNPIIYVDEKGLTSYCFTVNGKLDCRDDGGTKIPDFPKNADPGSCTYGNFKYDCPCDIEEKRKKENKRKEDSKADDKKSREDAETKPSKPVASPLPKPQPEIVLTDGGMSNDEAIHKGETGSE